MKIAVVDIGSNTIKMKIYNYSEQKLNELYSEVKNTKLISYIKDGILSDEGISLLCQAVWNLKQSAKNENADSLSCFATASLRRTKNIEKIRQKVFEYCQETIDLISGNTEAEYSFSGIKNTMNNFSDNGIMLDMGGGSTEIVWFKNKQILSSYSMDFGSLSLYLDYFEKGFEIMKDYAVNCLKQCPFYPVQTKNAILVGGTALAINRLYTYFYSNSVKYEMDCDKLEYMYEILKIFDDSTMAILKKYVPDRITTVIPGLSAFLAIFKECGIEKIKVSTAGIREGYVFEKILKETDFLL